MFNVCRRDERLFRAVLWSSFADFYEQVLKGMSDEDVIKMYMVTFGKQEDIVIEK